MARAYAHHTTNLSSLIRGPFVRAAFEAAERDGLAPLAVLIDTPPALDCGAAAAFDRETKLVEQQNVIFLLGRVSTHRHIPRIRAPTLRRTPWLGVDAGLPATTGGQLVLSNKPSN
jgi:hypothetical protein